MRRTCTLAIVFAALFIYGFETSQAFAEPRPASEAPPSQPCPNEGNDTYGQTSGYCIDTNKDLISYLEVNPITAEVGDVVELKLYTDRGKNYPLVSTFIYPPIHWNCGEDEQLICNDAPQTTQGPSARVADPALAGPVTEVKAPITISDEPCNEVVHGTCENGWLRNFDSNGRLAFYTKSIKILSANSKVLNKWVVLSSGNEAEAAFAVIGPQDDNDGGDTNGSDGDVRISSRITSARRPQLICTVKVDKKKSADKSVTVEQAASKDGDFVQFGSSSSTKKNGTATFSTTDATVGNYLRCRSGDSVSSSKPLKTSQNKKNKKKKKKTKKKSKKRKSSKK